MLTKVAIRKFKRLLEAEFELGKSVVFIGPNNSGKTTALQALALWDTGMRAWSAKREGKTSPEKRPGVTINRKDIIASPVHIANTLWHGMHVRRGKGNEGESGTQNIRIDIELSGITKDIPWKCGLEFDFSNEESIVCRPLRMPGYEDVPVGKVQFSAIPPEAADLHFAFLPPMAGLSTEEPLLPPGRINVLVGRGQTSEVLRNLCYRIVENDRLNKTNDWGLISACLKTLFGTELLEPEFIKERGEITLEYQERGMRLPISATGLGFQQTLLLLAYLYGNPKTVLLLDEPDAHLEVLRQREIYHTINEVAETLGSQIIAASHSEVILNEAAAKGTVIAFVGKPHRINDRGSHLAKSLQSIGWDQYYQAEETGWVLYVEGPTDLEILRSFALTLGHEKAFAILSRPFVHFLGSNHPPQSREHFNGLKEAKNDLTGIAIFDRLDRPLRTEGPLMELMWKRREIENYFCTREVLLAYARHDLEDDDLFGQAEIEKRITAMEESIKEVIGALETLGKPKAWSSEIKASDDFLDPLFRKYFEKLKLPLLMRKADYHQLAKLLPKEQIDWEIVDKLDAIIAVAEKANPVGE